MLASGGEAHHPAESGSGHWAHAIFLRERGFSSHSRRNSVLAMGPVVGIRLYSRVLGKQKH